MTDLNHIISILSLEEQHRFISYLEKKNKRNDTKNIALFKYILKGETDAKTLCLKLYGGSKQNAYHALRKRLYQSIIDFIANVSIEDEKAIDMQIIKFILASRTCLLHKHYKTAYKILDKAEKLAIEYHLFPLLNEIYHTKIQYAYANPIADIDQLIAKYEDNQKRHFLEDQLNIVYAKIRQTLNQITYKGDIIDIQTLLKDTLKKHNVTFNESMSFKSLYQLMSIIGLPAFITNDYLKTEPFLINTYSFIIKHKRKGHQLYYHIQILYLIANTLFRNKKFNDALYYLEQMHQHMLLQRKKHYNTFTLKYHLLLGLNLNFSNKPNEAITLLEPLIKLKHPDTETLLDIHLSLIMFYFQQSQLKKAQHLFSKLNHTDKWYIEKSGKEWVIKKNLIEILLHIDLGNINLADSRLLSFKRNHFKYLKSINQERVIRYVTLIENYYKNPETVISNEFRTTIDISFDWISPNKEDIFVMSFYAWLKSKTTNKNIYLTTLNLINMAKT